ncbi:MAG: Hpt domain-containing protein [Maritimibacter sp.]|nr:Hpt domain-containing protein [Maritimibacter sp.]
MQHDPELQVRFEMLQSKYLTTFEDYILDLDALLMALPTSGDQHPVMDAIRFRVHRIAGTAPSLGYVSVGGLAAKVEELIGQWSAAQSWTLEQQIGTTLESLLDEMEGALDAQIPALPIAATG